MLVKALLSLRSPGGQSGRLSILIYHRVLPAPDPLLPGEPDALTFQWQMRLVARHFRPLPLASAINLMREGRLPSRAISVTFDDGYADNADLALPILRDQGIPATFFVATAFLGGGRMFNDTVIETVRRLPAGRLDVSELGFGCHELGDAPSRIRVYSEIIRQAKYLPQQERDQRVTQLATQAEQPLPDDLMMRPEQVLTLRHAGMEIGGHTHSHPILAQLTDPEAEREIHRGRDELEALLGERISVFAYPNGKPGQDYHDQHVAMVERAGFDAAVSTAWGAAKPGSDRFQLPRFTPWDRSPTRFLLRLIRNLR
ncbi:polysaccharide deacetylase family protein [Thiorhodococcus mannitoliphagus]|uniref:Polysaccharide deacetylase family protein n=1 Tax=Thiorhodococcus mannitoliphagus TaxID=329406 RepID=A0A6P1DZS2_9GAMM|nr:polysaccharide deacetylase family protein [Thiorhodococcus mannitoliphagus]NEX22543.1 polysaccharide deacetylase family protein [Thiorhodococcus mannitoliphagus]